MTASERLKRAANEFEEALQEALKHPLPEDVERIGASALADVFFASRSVIKAMEATSGRAPA